MAMTHSLRSIDLHVCAMLLAFVPLIRADWRVTYCALQRGVGDFTSKIFICGEQFMVSSYSGFEIDNRTMECKGLPRNWTSTMQTTEGYLYAVKSLVRDVYNPPLVVYNKTFDPVPYEFHIPGILTTDTRVTVVVQVPDGLPKFTVYLEHNSSDIDVSFRMRCLLSNLQAKFVHCENGSNVVPPVESLDLYPYSVDTPITIEFLILDSVIQINVDGTHYHNWTHRYPPSEFENVKILVPREGTHVYLHSVTVTFPDG